MTGPIDARIYDVRYQRYSGELRSRFRSVLAFIRAGWLRALGIRRSAGSKVWPFFLVACVYLPVIVVTAVAAIGRDAVDNRAPAAIMSYATFLSSTGLAVIVFIASTVPSLLTKDRRDHVLSLYFSTALSRPEYLIGRIVSAFLLGLFMTLGPMLLLFIASVLVAERPLDYLQSHIDDVPRFLAAALLISLYHALVALCIGSLTPRRTIAVGAYLVILLISGALAGGLAAGFHNATINIANLATLPYEVGNAVLHKSLDYPTSRGVIAFVIVCAVSLVLLCIRYARTGGDR
jgi:ABC-2 type transport system permease protein